jgi:hypothetical protein
MNKGEKFKMAIHNFKPKKYTNFLEEGKYTGTIEKIEFYEEKGYFAVDIRTENAIFNTTFSTINPIFNELALGYTDDDENFDDEELIGQRVAFEVKDGAKKPELRSRVVMIKTI